MSKSAILVGKGKGSAVITIASVAKPEVKATINVTVDEYTAKVTSLNEKPAANEEFTIEAVLKGSDDANIPILPDEIEWSHSVVEGDEPTVTPAGSNILCTFTGPSSVTFTAMITKSKITSKIDEVTVTGGDPAPEA